MLVLPVGLCEHFGSAEVHSSPLLQLALAEPLSPLGRLPPHFLQWPIGSSLARLQGPRETSHICAKSSHQSVSPSVFTLPNFSLYLSFSTNITEISTSLRTRLLIFVSFWQLQSLQVFIWKFSHLTWIKNNFLPSPMQ